jgi:hypothetical protein
MGKMDSIFARTAPPASPSAGRAAAPPVASSIENKMTVIMPPDQVAFLDNLCLDIRAKTRSKIRRTEIIRALVAGLMTSDLDLTAYGTEEEVAAAIRGRLKG